MFEDRSKLQLPGFGPPWHIAISEGILSVDAVVPNRTLLQYYHLLRGHIACCLQRIEVGAASYLFS